MLTARDPAEVYAERLMKIHKGELKEAKMKGEAYPGSAREVMEREAYPGSRIADVTVDGGDPVYVTVPHIGLIVKCEEVLVKLDDIAKVLAKLTGASAEEDRLVGNPTPGSLNQLEARIGELAEAAQHLWTLAVTVRDWI